MPWLEPHNLLFLAPLVLGVVLLALPLLSGGGKDAGEGGKDVEPGKDVEHGADHAPAKDFEAHELHAGHAATHPGAEKDAPGHGGGLAGTLLDLLGVGRWPLSFLLPCWFLLFGGSGLACNFAQGAVSEASLAGSLLRGCAALAISLGGTSMLARLFGRLLPRSTTAVARSSDLVGRLGQVLFDVSAEAGWVRVRDRTETIHDLQARCLLHRLPAGSEVLVVDYSPETGVYEVEPSPFAVTGGLAEQTPGCRTPGAEQGLMQEPNGLELKQEQGQGQEQGQEQGQSRAVQQQESVAGAPAPTRGGSGGHG